MIKSIIPRHSFVLAFEIDRDLIDANICPRKSEVHFQVLIAYQEFSVVAIKVKQAFGKKESRPKLDRSAYVPLQMKKKQVTSGWKQTVKPLEKLVWKNPVFRLHEKEIKQVDTCGEQFRFDKSVFAMLEVIGQVDAKFIACKLKYEKDSLLVLVDQHAADERIKLELYLSQYYNETDDVLLPFRAPIDYLVLLREFGDHLKRSGINVEVLTVSKVTFTGTIRFLKPFVSITEQLALELLLKCLDYLKKHDEVVSMLPPVLDYFKSKACR